MPWKVVDAASGVIAEGETEIAPMRSVQPWPSGEHARALLRGSGGAAA
jgi:hypothetical protein